jgi:arabinogalactan oligomer / maltooligosaccharide transport system permease protein
MKKSTVSPRARFGIGLLIGLLIGIFALTLLLGDLREAESARRAQRSGIITTLSLTEIVKRAAANGSEQLQKIVEQIALQNPDLRLVRVIRGVRLEASTASEDRGNRTAPRRLSRDEKWLYDQGQRLRAAFEINREEEVPRKREIEINPIPSGGLQIAAPIQEGESIVGFVQAETKPVPAVPQANWLLAIPGILIPFAVYLLLARFINGSAALAVIATILLAVSVAAFGWRIRNTVEQDHLQTEKYVASIGIAQEKRTESTMKALGLSLEAGLHPSTWDTDVFRRPQGVISDSGAVNQNKVKAEMQGIAAQIRKTVTGVTIVSIAVLAFFGFGVASKLGRTLVEYKQAYAYTAPAMIGMIVLVFFPFLYGITLSFTGSSLYNSDKPITQTWVGVRNYLEILGDFRIIKHTPGGIVPNYANFYYTFFFTVIWTVSNVAIGVTVGLLLALILNSKGLALRPIYRVLLIFPWAMPNYITALIWKGMFHQQFGVINQVIQLFGGNPVSWFEKPFTSFVTALATNGWLSFPFMMVVSLGALQSIPADLYEAARVDGAKRWQQFRFITLPSLKPALIPAIILSVVWTFNMFNIIYLVTGGQPAGSTEILITQAYKIAFEQYRYGYAAAYSTVIFAILLIYGVFQNRITSATEAIAG